MNATEQARFDPLYESMQRALKLQGKAKATKGTRTRAQYDAPPSISTAVRTT